MNRGKPIRIRNTHLQKELLFALERARSRLAVAIAAENKFTSREKWRQYLETEDRLRKCVREIRNRCGTGFQNQFAWLTALDLLTQPLPNTEATAAGEATLLCQRLFTVLEIIGKTKEPEVESQESE